MSCDGSTRPYPSGMPVQLCYVDRAAADFFPSSAKKVRYSSAPSAVRKLFNVCLCNM